ncbi:MAG: flagellar hook-length control protein FliK, partial [Deltaproteobacteria bacterium]|nr:flagellar hook-length control protein FliK [Deltaproteobacteria bacterium]
MLNKPEVGASLRQQQSQDSSLVTMATPSTVETATGTTSSLLTSNGAENDPSLTLSADSTGKSELFGVNMPTNQNVEGGISTATHPQLSTLEVAGTQQSGPAIALKDGSSVLESRVVQQTIDHLTLHSRGDSSSVTVKLHPEELGEIQLRMVMEGDQLKVHLQAQSQQVQEVLERNFPRLRDALQEQGVTVDDFQVSVDSG